MFSPAPAPGTAPGPAPAPAAASEPLLPSAIKTLKSAAVSIKVATAVLEQCLSRSDDEGDREQSNESTAAIMAGQGSPPAQAAGPQRSVMIGIDGEPRFPGFKIGQVVSTDTDDEEHNVGLVTRITFNGAWFIYEVRNKDDEELTLTEEKLASVNPAAFAAAIPAATTT